MAGRGDTEKTRHRIRVALVCSVCSSRNYKTTKAPRDGAPPLSFKKHCKTCNAHTEHREAL